MSMPSFRHRIQRVSLLIMALLMAAFSSLLYIGLSVILYTHVDNDLRLLAQAEAQEIELSTGHLMLLPHQEDHDERSRKHHKRRSDEDEHEIHELREAIRSSIVLAPDGAVLWTGENARPPGVVSRQSLDEARQGHTVFETIHLQNDSPLRRIFLPIVVNGDVRFILQSDTSLRFVEETLQWLLWVLAGAAAIVLFLAWKGSNWLARQVLTPIDQVSRTASNITGQSLDTRIAMTAPYAEFQHLAQAFNSMLDRLQQSFDAQHRFVADAAHELKTPLTAMKGHMEVILQKSRTPEEYREAIVATLGDTERLNQLTKSLLALAQLSGDRPSKNLESVNLQEVAQEVQNELQILAEDKGITLRVESEAVPPILGDAVQIKRMVINLLDNALRHTPIGGTVRVHVAREQQEVTLSVADTGPGIAPEHLPHLFDRFYRVDTARDRQSGGTGLGLALVKEIAEAHDGQVHVESKVGKGTVFTIQFPLNHESESN